MHPGFPHRYFIIYKPVNMVSQFVSPHPVRLLGDLDFDFPEYTHAVGRLDNKSEGLLILTTNKSITGLLLKPPHRHKRTYHVMVKYNVTEDRIEQLRNGVAILISANEWYTTAPAEVSLIESSPYAPEMMNSFIKQPSTWLSITLTEGKYHQIRKMVAAVGNPCRRLIRVSIEDLELTGMKPGEVREMDEENFFELLHLRQ